MTVEEDSDAQRLRLQGHYTMRISAEGVALLKPRLHSMSDTLVMSPTLATPQKSPPSRCLSEGAGPGLEREGEVVLVWKLAMLKRFNIDKELFVLDCGP